MEDGNYQQYIAEMQEEKRQELESVLDRVRNGSATFWDAELLAKELGI